MVQVPDLRGAVLAAVVAVQYRTTPVLRLR